MEEVTLKVPSPFLGVSDLGFTIRYPEGDRFGSQADVPLLFEGPANPMRRLLDALRLLRSFEGRPYRWTDPILLADEVMVMAFRDQSLEGDQPLTDGPISSLEYISNLVRPVVFPFLRDCAEVANLCLSNAIDVQVKGQRGAIADLHLRVEEIVSPNGGTLLWSY